MVRGFNHQRGTLAQGVYNGFSRQDAIFFGRNGFGKHNAVTALPVSANDRGDGSQVNAVTLQKAFLSAPAQKCRIYIYVKKDCIHQDTS